MTSKVFDNFYEEIKQSLYRHIGRELQLARYVLDLGCGSCDLVKYLAETYHQQVTGVDISSESFPERSYLLNGIEFHCIRSNASNLDFIPDNSIDAVVSVWALHEMNQPESVLNEIRRVLRPGGKILIVDFPKDSLAQKLWNENYYKPDEIKQFLVNAGFVNIRVRVIEKWQVIWATGHHTPVEFK